MSSAEEPKDHRIRIAPLPDTAWPAETADMLSGFAGRLNVYRTMAHHPALLRSWANLREHIVNRSALGQNDLEVVILRTGHRLGSGYEWSQHVVRGRKAGLSDAAIRSLRGPLDEMSTSHRLLCTAVDELFDNGALSTKTLSRTVGAFGKQATFDLMATVGFYLTLGFIVQSCSTPLDADIKAELDANPLD